MSGLSCTGTRRDKVHAKITDRKPSHSDSGEIRAQALHHSRVINIGEALIDLYIIGRADTETFICDQLSGRSRYAEGQISADREFTSLIGVGTSISQLIREVGDVHALHRNAVAGTLCRKMREICRQVLAVDVLVVQLCLDRQLVIACVGILLAERADRNRGTRILLRNVLLHQRETDTRQPMVSARPCEILHLRLIVSPVQLIGKAHSDCCDIGTVFHINPGYHIVNAALCGRHVAVICRIFNVLHRTVRKCRIENERLVYTWRLKVKAHSIDEREQLRTRTRKVDARVLVRDFRNIISIPSHPRVVDLNAGEFIFTMAGKFSRYMEGLCNAIYPITRRVKMSDSSRNQEGGSEMCFFRLRPGIHIVVLIQDRNPLSCISDHQGRRLGAALSCGTVVLTQPVNGAILCRVVIHLLALIVAVEAIDHARKVKLLRQIGRTVCSDHSVIVQMPRIDALQKETVLLKAAVHAGLKGIDLIRRHDNLCRIGRSEGLTNSV